MTDYMQDYRKVKVSLMQNPKHVFIASVLFNLRTTWSEEVPTAGVNETEIIINPTFFNSLTMGEKVGLFAHEAWHIALMHGPRRGNRKPDVWNFAGDYVINLILHKAGVDLPVPHLLDHKYDGMTTDEVYQQLMDDMPEEEELEGVPMDIMGAEGGENGDTAQDRETIKKVEDILAKANLANRMYHRGKNPSTGSAELDRRLNELFNPTIPWQIVLMNHMTNFHKDDYSYKRFNRRYLPEYYLPTLYSEAVGDINCYIDLSGSVSDDDQVAFLTECKSIAEMLNPSKMVVQSFDTQLHSKVEIDPTVDVGKLSLIGGGGTDIVPVIKDIEESKPEITIIFTDGYFYSTHYADAGSSSSIFWIIYDNPNWTCPVGTVIHFRKEDLI